MKTIESGLKSVSISLGISKPEESTWTEQFESAIPSMSYQARIFGFGTCFIIGWIINFASLAKIPAVLEGRATGFAMLYTLGNLVGIASTCFLWGPCGQIKKMFEKIRIVATCIYFASMILTIIVAIKIAKVPLVLACMFIQLCAMIWYAASYIPYGRAILEKAVCGCCM